MGSLYLVFHKVFLSFSLSKLNTASYHFSYCDSWHILYFFEKLSAAGIVEYTRTTIFILSRMHIFALVVMK